MLETGFLEASGHSPDARAVFDGNTGEWLTRAELTQRVADFARRLRFPRKALGFLFALNNSESLIAYLSTIEAGHAVAMLNPVLDLVLSARLISLFQPDFIIAPESHAPAAAWTEGAGYQVAESPHAGQLLLRATAPNRYSIHADLALLISTSGSTGSPKLVRLSRNNLESNARQINQALRNSEQDRTMITAPIFNGYGQSVVHTMLLCGGSFALTRARVVSLEFWDAVRRTESNAIGGTPFFYQALERLDLNSLNVPLLKKFVQIGGRLPGHLATKFHSLAQERGGELHLMYGQAEATARISGLPPDLLPEARASVGFALSGGRLWVERDGCECPPLEEGELVYQGPNVMMGYATCPEDLAKGDELGGVVATGDLGYRDGRGLFYITGRKARFVKLHGWRVSLDEVEELLWHAAPVAAVNHQDRLVVYVERPGVTFGDAVNHLAARLNLHPSGFEIREVDSIPRLANGKVDYLSLADTSQRAPAGASPALASDSSSVSFR